jgi:hypothetical protein
MTLLAIDGGLIAWFFWLDTSVPTASRLSETTHIDQKLPILGILMSEDATAPNLRTNIPRQARAFARRRGQVGR